MLELLWAQGSYLRVRCQSCGSVQVVSRDAWARGAARCVCQQKRVRLRAVKLLGAPPASQAALDLPWLDRRTRWVLRSFPDGLEPAELAQLLGVEEQEVVRIEEQALGKMRRALES